MFYFFSIRSGFWSLLFTLLSLDLVAAQNSSVADPASIQYGHSSLWQGKLALPDSLQASIGEVIEVGKGRSQVVADGDVFYVTSGSNERDDKSKITQVTTAIRAYSTVNRNVKQKWSHVVDSQLRGNQQTFGGAEATPQSTPLVIAGKLIALTFTGQLICLDSRSGNLLWQQDLVQEYGAEPVQFGFSASPVIDSFEEQRIVVLAAGEQGGLLNLNASDGSLNWKSKCTTSSYATPTYAKFGGVEQWVIVSEDEVLGIGKDDGKRLWEYKLPEAGLTNVPSPIVIDDSRLLIAGQGCDGIRCVSVSANGTELQVRELWHQPKAEFFYTNWMMLDERFLIGSTSSYLAAIDTTTGELAGRWRGFSNGNLIRVDGRLILLDGKGKMTVFELQTADRAQAAGNNSQVPRRLVSNFQVKLPVARYWTPPTIVDEKLIVRSGSRLITVSLSRLPKNSEHQPTDQLANELSTPVTLALESQPQSKKPDPVAEIFDVFQQQGQFAALKRYAELRQSNSLNVTQRIQLAEAAEDQSLTGLAPMILQHANEDFPGNAEIQTALARVK